jgi:hypothetical protein
MKAHWFGVLIATILLTPAYAHAQDVAGNVTYEKVGHFVYATTIYTIDHCSRTCANPFVTLSVKCPTGYVAVGGGYHSTARSPKIAKYPNALFNIWADEPTKDRTGWLLGAARSHDATQQVGMVVTCALATQ